MVEKTCKFCHKTFSFEHGRQFGGHVTHCSENPNSSRTREALSKRASIPRSPRVKTKLSCLKCDAEFEIDILESEFKRNKYKKYCSYKCSHSHAWTDRQKKKISKTLKSSEKVKLARNKRYLKVNRTIKKCKYCNKEFVVTDCDLFRKFCSRKCSFKGKDYSKVGGYRTNSGRSKFHGGRYKDLWFDSSWELRFAKLLDRLNINWIRNSGQYKFPYVTIDGKDRNYYPDFYLPDRDLFVEIKGYWTTQIKHKIEDACKRSKFNLVILESLDAIDSFN